MTRPPRHDEPVLLATGAARNGGAPVLARVLRATPTTLDLEVDVPLRSAAVRLDVTLEYVADEGVCRLLGHARSDPDPHVLHVEHRGRAQLLQRAEAVQASMRVPCVAIRLGDRDAVAARGVTALVGGGGVVVRGIHGAHVGEAWHVELELPDGKRAAAGQVRIERLLDGGGFDGRWTRLNAYDRARVVRAALERRRTAAGRAA